MARGDDLEERMIAFAVRFVNVSGNLPKTQAGRHIGDQLLRSGTSPSANYAEARRAESKRDFVHKLKICLKELNEAHVWLRIIVGSVMLKEEKLQSLTTECNELCKIISASIQTSQTTDKINN